MEPTTVCPGCARDVDEDAAFCSVCRYVFWPTPSPSLEPPLEPSRWPQPPPPPPAGSASATPAAAGVPGSPEPLLIPPLRTSGAAADPGHRRRRVRSLTAAGLATGLVVLSAVGIYVGGAPDPRDDDGLTVPVVAAPTVPPVTPGSRNDCEGRSFRCLVDEGGRIVSVSGVACPNRVAVVLRDSGGHTVSRVICGMTLGDGKQVLSDDGGTREVFETIP